MPNARHIIERKRSTQDLPHQLVSVAPQTSVLDAARTMNAHHIGSLVVLDDNKLAGIFTERDVLQRVVAEQRNPASTTVGEVMTTAVACATPETSTPELRQVMRQKRIRHVPVVESGGTVIGLVSIGDLNRTDQATNEQTIRYLEQYMSVS